MEDNHFWDELARRLRQEQSQPFQEEDWASVHRQLRVQRKRRPGWLWPLLIALAFLGNNLIWCWLWQRPANGQRSADAGSRRDTIYLIQERIIRDTFWQQTARYTGTPYHSAASPKRYNRPALLSEKNEVIHPATPDTGMTPKTDFTSALFAGAGPEKTATRPNPDYLQALLPFRLQAPTRPARLVPVSGTRLIKVVNRRAAKLFLTADAGNGWFVPTGTSGAYLRHFGAAFHALSGQWGTVAGLRRWYAAENPKQTPAALGLPDDCENCPVAGYPDQVRLEWLEFQLGLVYQLPLPGKTRVYLGAMGQLRGQVDQYRHFHFDQYGGPPIDVEDRYREKSGLYWSGWGGKIMATHRLWGPLALNGSLDGRWPAGVNPRLTPASVSVNLGLAWYFKD